MMVVPYRPGQRVLFTLLVFAGVAVSAAGGWGYAYYTTVLAQQGEQADTRELSAQITDLLQETDALIRHGDIIDRLSTVDQQT